MKEKNSEIQKARKNLAHALEAVKESYNRKNHGKFLTILGPLISSLSAVTIAQTVKEAAPALLLSFKIALQGIEKEESSAGIIGKALTLSTQRLVDFFIRIHLLPEDQGNKQLLLMISRGLVLTTIALSWALTHFSFTYTSPLKEKDEKEQQRKQSFGIELALILTLKTGICQKIVGSFVSACGATAKQQQALAALILPLLFILSLLTVSRGNKKLLEELFLHLKAELVEGLENLQTFLPSLAGEPESIIGLYIQQATASLKEEDFEHLYQAYTGVLESIDATPSQLNEEIEDIIYFAETIYTAFRSGSKEFSHTTVSQLI
ncbi:MULTISPECIES: hypothetical protein [unclassified Neochlamydia]|uniref:hypothetical protein n=1 Tax=unclassified Neochlamydia TaxID=2643326 RepID=UPI001BC9D89A|nr:MULTISPECIES: hypothetical protein [unclassified Neochlamydia]MBS4165180.1 Uncharacterized protein [Neochlamydia sp. AcF65]MBS4170490.1 Uncharacterized protein [Neochlamydia sp. AcF95]